MSSLFSLARIRSEPGAKLYLFQSGTTTPQNAYTDPDLQVAHAHPIVADAAGYFDPIYPDPSLPDYRYILTDGSNEDDDYTLEVLLEPITDDYPSSQTQSAVYRLKGVNPDLVFEETDASLNKRKWRIRANNEILSIERGDDAEATWTPVFGIDRNGEFYDVDGNNFIAEQSGSFTGTLSGMSGSTTGTVHYARYGGLMTLHVGGVAITGTSNNGAMQLTGMPANVLPKDGDLECLCGGLLDDGNLVAGHATLSNPGGLGYAFTFKIVANPLDGFTTSGTKGLSAGFLMTYFVRNTYGFTP